jgi:hypothetical protein
MDRVATDPTDVWTPRRGVGAFVALVLAAYLYVLVRNWPGDTPLLVAMALGVVAWLGSLAAIHLLRAGASRMRVPAIAALALGVVAWGVIGYLLAVQRTWSLHDVAFTVVPASVPLVFGIGHLAAARGRPVRRTLRIAWALVVLTGIDAGAFLVDAIGRSGMGGG